MAGAPNTSSALIVAFVLCLCVANAFSASPCADGVYPHEGRNCCRCAIGMRVLEHCTTDLQYGICEKCQNETYSSVANGETKCDACKSCTHINANQVENTTCVPSADRTCRCKEDHFCPDTRTCGVCNPCTKCGAEGIKVACKGNSDTICNEKNEGHSHVGMPIGVVAGVICVAVLAGIGVLLYKRRQRGSRDISDQCSNENKDEAASFIPDEGDLEHLFPDLAKAIGWQDMRDIALRSRLSDTEIESCKLSYPHDAYEQTLVLLRIWNEKQGRGAGNRLKQMLQDAGKKRKAEEVTKILLRSARNNSPV